MSTERQNQERPGFLRRLRNRIVRILASVPAQIKIAPTLAVTVAVTFSLSLYTYTTVVAGDTGWESDGASTATALRVTIDRALEVKNDIRITGSVLEMAGSVCSEESPAGRGRLCFDGDRFRLSQDGGGYVTLDGLQCWDRDGDGRPDGEENRSGDGVHDALDCVGPAGPVGPRGVRGDPGSRGPQGDAGERGLQGLDGQSGVPGRQGDPGARGDKGDTGPRGLTGLKGDKGDSGPQGLTGDKGDVGLAAAVTANQSEESCVIQLPASVPIAGGTATLVQGACKIVLSDLALEAAKAGRLNVQLTAQGDAFKLVPIQLYFQALLDDEFPFIWVFESQGRAGSFDFLVQVLF